MIRRIFCVALVLVLGLVVSVTAKVSIPNIEKGKFNVAFVYVGPIGDGGWTYAHDQGRLYLEQKLSFVHTAYVENVSEGSEAEQVIRSLARKRFDLIVATSFGFMDACEIVAQEFPSVKFLHISGFKKNDKNFANLMGAMESMKYLAGMIAGARAKADGAQKIGYIAPFPIAEVIRLGNALALGMRRSCPDCRMEIRWINTWFDPVKEREAAESLLKAGCDVVITGADTPGPVIAAGEAGKWGIGYDSENACQADPVHCLTVPYWNWGVEYVRQVEAMKEGRWKPGDFYPDVDSGLLALYGFMDGQTPNSGVPAEIIPEIRKLFAAMNEGTFTRFDIFRGPIHDNTGTLRIARDQVPTQEDLEGLKTIPGRPDCAICMNWLVEGIIGQLP